MKWLSISLIVLYLVACRSKQTTISEQKVESMQLHGAHGVTICDYYCSDTTPLLLHLDTVHPFRIHAKAQEKTPPHHERLILTTYTADTQRVSCAHTQEKVVVTKDRLFSFSYDDFVVIVFIVLGVGLLLKLLR